MNFKVEIMGVVVGLLLGPTQLVAQSCPCPTFDLAAIVKEADVIFVGKSLTATTDSNPPMKDSEGGWTGGSEVQTRLAFDVQTLIKGEVPRFVEVTSPSGICGFAFSVGKRYLVAGMMRGAGVATDSCRGNVFGSEAIEARVTRIQDLLRREAR